MAGFIPLSVPNFCGNEKKYVDDALHGAWVSTSGAKVGEMEQCIAKDVGMPRAVAANSGSSALHLSAMAAGIRAGDEVLVPALTFIAAVNPVSRFIGAEPVFIGCDDSLCMDPAIAEDFCANHCTLRADGLYNNKTGARVAAIMVVHVFGNMADIPAFKRIAEKYKLVLMEDATEALGTYYTEGPLQGKFAGTMGDTGAYSFNGNKIITTGAGGMMVSNHADWAERAKHVSTQAKVNEVQFTHDMVGYNYRMTNIQACLGLAQMEMLEDFIAHKKARWEQYVAALDGVKGMSILPFRSGIRPNYWFYTLVLPDSISRDKSIEALSAQKIQTRPVWALVNEQCDYGRNEAYGLEKARFYREHVLNLPCSTNLTKEDCDRVIEAVLNL